MSDITALLRRKDNLVAAKAALAAGEAEIDRARIRLQSDCPHPDSHRLQADEHTPGGYLNRAETTRVWTCGICGLGLGSRVIAVGGYE